MANVISIFRKKVNSNIPGFSSPGYVQENTWIKLGDYNCVEYVPSETARTYQAEHAEKYHNNEDVSTYEFSFESSRQELAPPYDIKTGDYIGFKQGGNIFWHRIVKITSTTVLAGCCVIQIITNLTQPKEAQYMLECGALEGLSEDEANGGLIGDNREEGNNNE